MVDHGRKERKERGADAAETGFQQEKVRKHPALQERCVLHFKHKPDGKVGLHRPRRQNDKVILLLLLLLPIPIPIPILIPIPIPPPLSPSL